MLKSILRVAALYGLAVLGGCDTPAVSDAKEAVSRNMLDPDAAQFREVKTCSKDKSVVMGDVNGKNSYGAYVGFKEFFYSGYRVYYAGDPGWDTMMDRCFGKEITEQTRALIRGTPAASDASPAPTDLAPSQRAF